MRGMTPSRIRRFGHLILLVSLTMAIAGQVMATTYFSQGTANFTDTDAWNTAPDGSGTNFTATSNEAGNSFVIQGSHVISLGAGQTLDSLVIGEGGSLDMNTQSLQVINLAIDGDFDDLTGNTGFVNLSGNLTVGTNATFANNNRSSFNFDGSGTQVIGGSFTGELLFENLINSASGTVENDHTGNIGVNQKFRLRTGTFLAGSATFVLSYSANNDTCFRKEGGTFDAETSQFVYSGTTGIFFLTNTDIVFYKLAMRHGSTNSVGLRAVSTADTFYVANEFERGGSTNLITPSNSALAYYSGATLRYANGSNRTLSNEWPTTEGPTHVVMAATGSATVTINASRTISSSGTLSLEQASSGNFIVSGATTVLTINGTVTRRTSGTVGITTASGGTISYGSGSTLNYSPTTQANVTVGAEWPATSGPANVTVNDAGFTVTGSSARTIRHNLTLTAGTLTLGTNELTVLGDVSGSEVSGSGTVHDNTTLVMGDNTTPANSTEDQTITGNVNLNKLIVNKTGGTNDLVTVNGSMIFSSGGALTVTNGTLRMVSPGQITGSLATLTVSSGGRLETGGQDISAISTISAANGTIEFDGSSAETLPTGITIGTVEINNSSIGGVIATSGTLVIGSSLVLTNGFVTTTSSNVVRLSSTATVTGTFSSSRMIVGPLQKAFASGDEPAFTFPIGFTGSYLPATFDYSANDVSSSIIQIQAVSGDPGGTAPSGISSIATSHYYTITEVGTGGSFTYDITLTYTGTGFTPDSRNKIVLQNGATTYSLPTQGSASGGTQTVSGLTALPTNSGKAAFGAGSADKYWDGNGSGGAGNWSVAANWSDNALPLAGDVIVLDNSVLAADYVVVYDASTSVTSFDNIQINGTSNSVTLRLDKNTTIDLTNGTTGLTLSNSANSNLIYNTTSLGMNGGGYDASRTSIGAASTVDYRTGTVYADAYGNLTVNTTGSLTAAGVTTVSGNFTKSGSGSFDVANTSLSVTGTTDVQGGTLSTSGTGSVALGAVTNAGIITLSGSGASGMAGVTNTSTMTLNSTAGTVTFSGAYSGSGTLSATGATPNVTFEAGFSPGGSATFGSQTLTFQNDVTVTGGVLTLSSNSSFTGDFDFEVNGGTVSSSAGTITFTSGTGQTITGNVTFPSLTINNSNGVTITSGSLPTVTGTLALTSGLVNFGNSADYLTLNTAASLSGGSSTSYVNGKVRKVFATGSSVSGTFPVGKAGRYQPATITLGTVSAANPNVTIEQHEYNHPTPLTSGIEAGLQKVSRVRTWSVLYNANGATMSNPSALLTWDNSGVAGISDGLWGNSDANVYVIAQKLNGGGSWLNRGRSASSGTLQVAVNAFSGTLTSSTTAFTLTDGQTDSVTFATTAGDVSLPVELSRFEAAEVENLGHVALRWTTESEIENAYWLVQRKKNDGEFETVATQQGQGSTTSATEYEYVDTDVKSGDSLTYRLADVSFSGAIGYHIEKGVRLAVPEKYELIGNFPNPFNPTTSIAYKLPASSRVRLTVYNMLGQQVRALVSGSIQDAGVQRVMWDGRNDAGTSVASGIYIYRLEAGSYRMTKRMLFLK